MTNDCLIQAGTPAAARLLDPSAAPQFPIALARLEVGRKFWVWRVAACPVRGCFFRKHIHGGGPLAENQKDYLGHRSHLDGGRGYVLVDAAPESTARLIAQVRGAVRC